MCSATAATNWRYGLCALLGWGYFYGILRAHYVASYGHFIFDAASMGFYAGMLVKPPTSLERYRWRKIYPWFMVLTIWPIFMALIPIQHYLVQLVGLRGNIFFLPFLLIGCMLDSTGKSLFVKTMGLLNILVFGVALGEYFLGVETFVPSNEVTTIIFNSADIVGGNLRIPSTFLTAHAYAGTMVATLPWLVGEMLIELKRGSRGGLGALLLAGGTLCALIGVFIAGPRQPIVLLGLLIVASVLSGNVDFRFLLVLGFFATILAYFVSQNERMQRFTELQDMEMVKTRIEMSLNLTFLEVLVDYPMGNGVGAGGTSIPFFLQHLLDTNVKLENEYARVLLEQGLPGLILFVAFVAWVFTRRIMAGDPDQFSKTQLKLLGFVTFSTAFIGLGLMSSVPGTAMTMISIGFFATPNADILASAKNKLDSSFLKFRQIPGRPAYQRGLART